MILLSGIRNESITRRLQRAECRGEAENGNREWSRENSKYTNKNANKLNNALLSQFSEVLELVVENGLLTIHSFVAIQLMWLWMNERIQAHWYRVQRSSYIRYGNKLLLVVVVVCFCCFCVLCLFVWARMRPLSLFLFLSLSRCSLCGRCRRLYSKL